MVSNLGEKTESLMKQSPCHEDDLSIIPYHLLSHLHLHLVHRLRNLSDGGANSSQPGTPTMSVKFKLAEYRYGREEMLSLFQETSPPPDQVRKHLSIFSTEIQKPITMSTLTEDEQVIYGLCLTVYVVGVSGFIVYRNHDGRCIVVMLLCCPHVQGTLGVLQCL